MLLAIEKKKQVSSLIGKVKLAISTGVLHDTYPLAAAIDQSQYRKITYALRVLNVTSDSVRCRDALRVLNVTVTDSDCVR